MCQWSANVVLVAIRILSPLRRARRNSNKYAKCPLICREHDLFSTDMFITNWDHILRMRRSALWTERTFQLLTFQDKERETPKGVQWTPFMYECANETSTSNTSFVYLIGFHITISLPNECLLASRCSRFRPSWGYCYKTVLLLSEQRHH